MADVGFRGENRLPKAGFQCAELSIELRTRKNGWGEKNQLQLDQAKRFATTTTGPRSPTFLENVGIFLSPIQSCSPEIKAFPMTNAWLSNGFLPFLFWSKSVGNPTCPEVVNQKFPGHPVAGSIWRTPSKLEPKSCQNTQENVPKDCVQSSLRKLFSRENW